MLSGNFKVPSLVDQIMNDNPFVYVDLPLNLEIRVQGLNRSLHVTSKRRQLQSSNDENLIV